MARSFTGGVMIIVRVMEYAIMALFLLFWISQIFVPLVKGKVIFPLFFGKKSKNGQKTAEEELRETEEQLKTAEAKRTAAAKKVEIAQLKGETARLEQKAFETSLSTLFPDEHKKDGMAESSRQNGLTVGKERT